jgi:hypothetical protein
VEHRHPHRGLDAELVEAWPQRDLIRHLSS